MLRNIFGLEGSEVAVFKIFPEDAGSALSTSKLPRWIWLSGGVVLYGDETDPHVIPIIDYHWYIDVQNSSLPPEHSLPKDHFSSSFIYDSYIRGGFRDLDLNSYRIGQSAFAKYDANLILKRELAWDDLAPVPLPGDESQDECVIVDDDQSSFTSSSVQVEETVDMDVHIDVDSDPEISPAASPRSVSDGNLNPLPIKVISLASSSSSTSSSSSSPPPPAVPRLPKKSVKSGSEIQQNKSKSKSLEESPHVHRQEDELRQLAMAIPTQVEIKKTPLKTANRPKKKTMDPLVSRLIRKRKIMEEDRDERPIPAPVPVPVVKAASTSTLKPPANTETSRMKTRPVAMTTASPIAARSTAATSPSRLTRAMTKDIQARQSRSQSQSQSQDSQDSIPVAGPSAKGRYPWLKPRSQSKTNTDTGDRTKASAKETEPSSRSYLANRAMARERARKARQEPKIEIVSESESDEIASQLKAKAKEKEKDIWSISSSSSVDQMEKVEQWVHLQSRMRAAKPNNRTRSGARMEYTTSDGQKILDYICQHNLHAFTKGNQIWEEMEDKRILPRTAQSMKEHFRKKVYPNHKHHYNCSDEDIKKFRIAKATVNRGKRVPASSHYFRNSKTNESTTSSPNPTRSQQNLRPGPAFRLRSANPSPR